MTQRINEIILLEKRIKNFPRGFLVSHFLLLHLQVLTFVHTVLILAIHYEFLVNIANLL